MGAPYFRFKQFTVWHDRCAMKVGTDGVLLGAWAGQERLGKTQVNHPRNILDIGTGSGLIALMLAQRFPQARITGIDCDKDAAMQAMENFTGSPWADRLRAVRTGLQDFCRDTATAAERFDLIVSNPPFYDYCAGICPLGGHGVCGSSRVQGSCGVVLGRGLCGGSGQEQQGRCGDKCCSFHTGVC